MLTQKKIKESSDKKECFGTISDSNNSTCLNCPTLIGCIKVLLSPKIVVLERVKPFLKILREERAKWVH